MTIEFRGADKASMNADLKALNSEFNGGVLTRRLHPDGSVVKYVKGEDGEMTLEPFEFISGNRIDIVEGSREVITPAEYDEDGNIITEAVLGDHRARVYLPDGFDPKVDKQPTEVGRKFERIK